MKGKVNTTLMVGGRPVEIKEGVAEPPEEMRFFKININPKERKNMITCKNCVYFDSFTFGLEQKIKNVEMVDGYCFYLGPATGQDPGGIKRDKKRSGTLSGNVEIAKQWPVIRKDFKICRNFDYKGLTYIQVCELVEMQASVEGKYLSEKTALEEKIRKLGKELEKATAKILELSTSTQRKQIKKLEKALQELKVAVK